MRLALALLAALSLYAQQQTQPPAVVAGIPVNYDESKATVPPLPDPLKLANGKPVKDAKTWTEKRRPELLALFEEHQYGRYPARPKNQKFELTEQGPAFDGKAHRRQITIHLDEKQDSPKIHVLLYTPTAQPPKPAPVLLNISFSANSSTVDDRAITPGLIWNREKQKVPAAQGRAIGRINPQRLLDAGFAFATVYYGDIDPDFEGGLPHGVRALYLKPGQTQPAPNEWGAISAWAWGLSRVLDYLETEKSVDAKKVTLFGISRLGKTVLWTAARDPRFAAVIASCSGEGGAAISRRNYGETIAHLTAPTRYPYQFAQNYKNHAEHPENSPIDAHMLVALIAPRPVLLQTGDKDFWSDPKGEFLAAQAAAPVYKLLGQSAPDPNQQMPDPGQPLWHTLSYYMHPGGHGTIPSDWDQFLTFLTRNFKN